MQKSISDKIHELKYNKRKHYSGRELLVKRKLEQPEENPVRKRLATLNHIQDKVTEAKKGK